MFRVSGSILRNTLPSVLPEGKDAHTHWGIFTQGHQLPLGTLSYGFAPFLPPGTRQKSLSTCSHYIFGLWFVGFLPPKPWSHSFQETLLWSLDGFTVMLMKASDVPAAWLSLWVCLQERDWPTLLGLGHTTGRGWGTLAQFYRAASFQPGWTCVLSAQRQAGGFSAPLFLFLLLSIT